MAQFLLPSLGDVPDISKKEGFKFVITKISQDFPWILCEEHGVLISGIGQEWKGLRKSGQIISHAGLPSGPFFPLNACMAWLITFFDALRLARNGPCVALSPSPEAGFGVAIAKMFTRRRFYLVVRVKSYTATTALYVRKSNLQFRIIDALERFVLKRADIVVPMGKFTEDVALSHGVSSRKIINLPLPVFWADSARVTEPPRTPIVLFVGRLVKEKGIPVLFQAFTFVRNKIQNARLVVVGGGSDQLLLEEMAESLGIGDATSFLGWLQGVELQMAYENSSVLAMPSVVEEGLGMVLIEAGLMGRPVVASNLGGIREVVRHGTNGLLVQPKNPFALAGAIITILEDTQAAQAMGLNNNKIAREYLAVRDKGLECLQNSISDLIKR